MTDIFILHEYVRDSFCLNHCCKVGSIVNMTAISRDSAVSIATSYGLNCCVVKVQVPLVKRFFSSPYCQRQSWGPFRLLSTVYWGVGGKVARHEADHSPLTSNQYRGQEHMDLYIHSPYDYREQSLIS
jgi:hypothetical protein